MQKNEKSIVYKGRVVFQKVRVPFFTRLPKEYHDNEACFVFINQGTFYIRGQTERLQLNKATALLAKCHNYFYETAMRSSEQIEEVEVVGLLLYPELVQDLFDFDLKISDYKVDYNLKQIQVNELLALYRDSIGVLLDHPDLADEHLIKNKLREFVILMTKTVNAPSELDFWPPCSNPILPNLNRSFNTTSTPIWIWRNLLLCVI